MSESNLWGDLSNLKTIRTPKSILVEQADILNQVTQGVIRASVGSGQGSNTLSHSLVLVAPALANYTYTICTVQHSIEIYPCQLFSSASGGWEQCADEADFTTKLATILSSKKTRAIIESLISQSKV